MPRVKAKVMKTKEKDGKLFAVVQFDKKMPKRGEVLTAKWGSERSLPQNAMYWAFLNWCITTGGLHDHGHFFAESLHENLKKHLHQQVKLELEKNPTTTDMTKSEFSTYFELCNKFIQEFFEIDTSPFFEQYEKEFSAA